MLARFDKISPGARTKGWAEAAGGCVSIRLKFFWFSLFTTDAASEGNANAVCELPSGEEEGEANENSPSRGSAQTARHALGGKSSKCAGTF